MIFKKQICIFLTFFLLVSNVGLAFNVHYCGDKIASVTLSSYSQKVDECCGIVEKDSKCCKNKIIKAKINSDQIIAKSLTFDVEFLAIQSDWQPIDFVSNFNFNQRDNSTYYCNSNTPPLYLLFSQYTFYA